MIAFFGTGLLGGSFVRAMRRRDEQVKVWNRTADKARALASVGAVACDDPVEAARGATRVHLALSDDAAVDDVLERARPGLEPGVVIVDHTTTTPSGTAARARRWAERGIAFQHAPIFMGPQNALEGTGLMLGSGDRARFDALAPELSRMTGKLVYLGPQPERAAAYKLMGNGFLMCMATGLVEALTLARAFDIAPADAIRLFEDFNPGQTVPARARRIVDADFDHPSWELSMARKDARLMLAEAARADVPLTLIPAIAALMDRFIAEGQGGKDWMVIASDALRR